MIGGVMNADTVEELTGTTRRLRRRFAATAPQRWDAVTAGAELAVQVGHLSLCLLRRRQADVTDLEDPDRLIVNVADELADVVLSGVSVAVLADTSPTLSRKRPAVLPGEEVEEFLRLLVAAGILVEAAMVDAGYRHRPTGSPLGVTDACGLMLAACERLAERLGMDLLTEFRAMAASADQFLNDVLGGGQGSA